MATARNRAIVNSAVAIVGVISRPKPLEKAGVPMATLSAILCNYNHGKTVGRAIRAMATQSRPPDELIVVDDGSTDNSVEVIEPYVARYPFIRFFRNPRNKGLHASLQVAFEAMSGEYLYGAAADDYVLPGFFSGAMSLAEQYPDRGMIFGGYDAISLTGVRFARLLIKGWNACSLTASAYRDQVLLPRHNESFGPATIFKSAAFHEVGGLRQELRFFGDVFAAWAVGLKYGACYLPKSCMRFTVNPASYGNAITRNPHARAEVIREAVELMRSPKFGNLFPVDFVDEWERASLWAAEPVPLELDAVRDAFIGVVDWNSPLLKVFAVWMKLTRAKRSSPTPPDVPIISRHPLDLAEAFVRLADWRRPRAKLTAILLSVALRIHTMRGLIRR